MNKPGKGDCRASMVSLVVLSDLIKDKYTCMFGEDRNNCPYYLRQSTRNGLQLLSLISAKCRADPDAANSMRNDCGRVPSMFQSDIHPCSRGRSLYRDRRYPHPIPSRIRWRHHLHRDRCPEADHRTPGPTGHSKPVRGPLPSHAPALPPVNGGGGGVSPRPMLTFHAHTNTSTEQTDTLEIVIIPSLF